MLNQTQRIVIKIGSKILVGDGGRFNEKVVEALVKDIARVKNEKNLDIVLVSSGAVSLGKTVKALENFEIKTSAIKYNKAILKEQIFAAIGQPRLMAFYNKEFDKYHLPCAQILATRAVFADRQAYLSIRTVTESLLKLGVVPIFNENDVLSPEELDFSDNDQLASMVSAMLVADKLIILSSVDGVYENISAGAKARVIPEIDGAVAYLKNIDDSKSAGKGGMRSKLMVADLVNSLGIAMHVANGLTNNVVTRIINGEKIGTFFPAKNKKVKALKNWLATAAVGDGKLFVSTYLADILEKKQTASILITGVEKIEGDFDKNEVVEIFNIDGKILGRGLARFSAENLRKKIIWYSKKTDLEKINIKAANILAVHYDYFSFC